MAKVTITIWDDEGDYTKAKVDYDPPIEVDDFDNLTNAQQMGLSIADALARNADGPEDEIKVNEKRVK